MIHCQVEQTVRLRKAFNCTSDQMHSEDKVKGKIILFVKGVTIKAKRTHEAETRDDSNGK
jgi:hypothetical protein